MTDTTVVSKAPIPAVSVETLRVISRLRDTKDGDVVTWESLESLTGCNDRGRVREMARTAKRTLEKEMAHLRTITGVGIERLAHSLVATEVLPVHRKRIGGAARKMVKTARAVKLDDLCDHDKMAVVMTQTIGELVAHACSKESAARLAPDSVTISPYTAKEAFARLIAR